MAQDISAVKQFSIPTCRGASESTGQQSVLSMTEFHTEGVTVAEWARARGFSPRLVYVVLGGERKCLRGQSYQIARELGMK